MTRLGLILLAALATATRAWPRLEEALKNYPSIHARETARLKAGQPAKFVLLRRADEHADWKPQETWERIAPLLEKTDGGL